MHKSRSLNVVQYKITSRPFIFTVQIYSPTGKFAGEFGTCAAVFYLQNFITPLNISLYSSSIVVYTSGAELIKAFLRYVYRGVGLSTTRNFISISKVLCVHNDLGDLQKRKTFTVLKFNFCLKTKNLSLLKIILEWKK